MTTKYCPSCGAEVDENAKFCAECGADIDTVVGGTESSESASSETTEESSSGSSIVGKVLGYGVGALLLLAGLGGLLTGSIGGIVLLATGLFAMPRIRSAVSSRSGVTFSRYVVIGIVLGGLVVGGAALPSDTNAPSSASPGGQSDTQGQSSGTPTPMQVVDMDKATVVVEYNEGFNGHFGSKINQKNNHGEYKDLVLSLSASGSGDDDHDIGRYTEEGVWQVVVPENTGMNVDIRAPVIATATPSGNGTLTLKLYVNGQLVKQDTAESGEEARVEYSR